MKETFITAPECPFYHWELGKDLKCELAKFRFPDKQSQNELKVYCCDIKKHKECPLYKILMSYYERRNND